MKNDYLVMAKPTGSRCNLRCDYCYYVGKPASLFDPSAAGRMSDALLEQYIAQRCRAAAGPILHFEWHGGEPTLLGIDWFRRVVELQNRYRQAHFEISNGLQTNGTLIDPEWAQFLAANDWTVGLSMDGPAELHDKHRHSAGGEGSHAAALQAWQLLAKHKITVNVMCVLHPDNAAKPDKVYNFFRDLGVRYLQFLPLSSLDPSLFGGFLCRVFDLWLAQDSRRLVVQNFDEAIRPLLGREHSICVHRETCGDVLVLEHDGSVYSCDHFVSKAYRLGNILQTVIGDLASSERQSKFGQAKQTALPPTCLRCDVLAWCNGGCPKDRSSGPTESERGLNRLCSGYKQFFRHCQPGLKKLIKELNLS